jgi:hypothetical protein
MAKTASRRSPSAPGIACSPRQTGLRSRDGILLNIIVKPPIRYMVCNSPIRRSRYSFPEGLGLQIGSHRGDKGREHYRRSWPGWKGAKVSSTRECPVRGRRKGPYLATLRRPRSMHAWDVKLGRGCKIACELPTATSREISSSDQMALEAEYHVR